MTPIKQLIRKHMRERFADRLDTKRSYTRGSLPSAYQHVVEDVTTERCFALMEAHGLVVIMEDPDDLPMDGLFGDVYCPKANPDINPNVLAKQKQEVVDRLNAEGQWFVESMYRCPEGDGWQTADGIGGFIGGDFWGSGYETALRREALDRYAEQFGAPRYRDCHPDPLQRGGVYLAALRMCGAPIDIDQGTEERYLRAT